MESTGNSSSDRSQATGMARLPTPARVWLRSLSSSEPRVSSGSRGASLDQLLQHPSLEFVWRKG